MHIARQLIYPTQILNAPAYRMNAAHGVTAVDALGRGQRGQAGIDAQILSSSSSRGAM